MFSLNDIKKISIRRNLRDSKKKELVSLTSEFMELFTSYFSELIAKEVSEGSNEFNFLNFWTLSWEPGDVNKNTTIKSSYLSLTTTRGVTTRFVANDFKLSEDMLERFSTTLSYGPQHMRLIKGITQIARDKQEVNSAFRNGNNVAFIFRETFKSILIATFEEKREVIIPNLGSFKRGYKTKKKVETQATKGGVLQFYPNPNMKLIGSTYMHKGSCK